MGGGIKEVRQRKGSKWSRDVGVNDKDPRWKHRLIQSDKPGGCPERCLVTLGSLSFLVPQVPLKQRTLTAGEQWQ